jgi:subtilisin family serine protease
VDLTHATGFGGEGWGDFHNPVAEVRGVGGWLAQFPHGVAVSSVIVGFPSPLGTIAGAAPGATIVPIGILSRFNTAWSSWSIAGILYAANLKGSGAIPGPMVINFSLQYHALGTPTLFRDAILYAISQGVLFVTIAGNFHPDDQVSFPGRMPECITAAAGGWRSEGLATDPWFLADVPEGDGSQVYVAPFSGRELPSTPPGSQIDVIAPGSFVYGEWLSGPGFSEGHQVAYDPIAEFIFGTSFAAPHVTGIVARMLEKNPALTQAEAQAILRSTALPVPSAPAGVVTGYQYIPFGWDERATGAGLVQGDAAVAATPLSQSAGPSAAARAGAASPDERHIAAGRAEELEPSVTLATVPGRLPAAWTIRGTGDATLAARIFDLQGRAVRRLPAGSLNGGRLEWDGARDDGSRALAGVYVLRVEGAGPALFAKGVIAP